jgi:CRP-like cAMP-binding protein
MLLSGELELVDAKADKSLGMLKAGDVFGKMPLLEGVSAHAVVIARKKCWVIVLGEARFRRILAANPKLEPALHALARKRDRGVRERISDVAAG